MTKRKSDEEQSTMHGYAMPNVREALAKGAGYPATDGKSTPPGEPRRPAIDVELVVERKTAPYVERPWSALEIWTQNRIYSVDATMVCLEVVEKATGKAEPRHPLIGAHLVGGQHEENGTMELSHPFPRAGSEAVFEQRTGAKAARFSHTSEVERVVLRLRVLTVAPDNVISSWQDITSSFRAPVVPKP
jgi:hypothetical protein